MISKISTKTYLGKEIIINYYFSDIADLMESVTTLLFAAEYTLHEIKAGYEAELEGVKSRIQREIKEEQKTTENNE